MDDFREGNIVVLFVTTTGELPKDTAILVRLYVPPHPSAAEEFHTKFEAFRSGKIEAIEASELTFVEMQPAIGANLLATCERVEFRSYGSGS